MYLSVNDGDVVFATHIIKVGNSQENIRVLPFQVEKEGVICYSEDELVKAKEKLDEMKIEYKVEIVLFDNSLKLKTQNMKFKSRSEAIKYLTNDDYMPELEIIPTLTKRLAAAEQENKELKTELQKLSSSMKQIQQKVGVEVK